MSKKKENKSTLQEVPGSKAPGTISGKIKPLRKTIIEPSIWVKEIKKGNISYLSRAITLIESRNKRDFKKAHDLLKSCLPFSGKSIRIGITGVPGVGKSTFIDTLGTYLTELGKKVAVLAIDPSSSVNKGSILGDKTRMENLAANHKAFIRPSPAGQSLGGVAQKTKESIVLCEAAGFDMILIETVGVGQSEILAHSMVDFFLLLKVAGTGDELQGIKRGIIELADAIVINKADGDNIKNAEFARSEFKRALHLYPPKENQWVPDVSICSALNNTGIVEIWEMIGDFISLTQKNGWFKKNRQEQDKKWLYEKINEQLHRDFYNNDAVKKEIKKQIREIEEQKITPFEASLKLLEFYRKKSPDKRS